MQEIRVLVPRRQLIKRIHSRTVVELGVEVDNEARQLINIGLDQLGMITRMTELTSFIHQGIQNDTDVA